ncbi:NAD(P)H-binding protein [Luteibacter flocculans]|uniref:NAD(P)H-binding protein n=1 Tax=Luteibacter flocculans TaxID=2780091 RepID=A0ABY4T636_9GAMM|nr:NAD(P)H-binding protein [Luteibacter flocculans]URL59680.1 NAD(P)H-binding protein [Luteibacter flocculans]
MKIVLFGATGNIGKVILDEALARGHQVTAVVRDPTRVASTHASLSVVTGDVGHPESYAQVLRGADAAIASLNDHADPANVPKQAGLLLGALTEAGVPRFAWVGGAGSLEVSPGVRVIDDPHFPDAWKPSANAQIAALDVFRASDAKVDWTYISPAAELAPGERTGAYRLGDDRLLVDAEGHSRISIADFAIGVLDRIERGDAPKKRVTFAY